MKKLLIVLLLAAPVAILAQQPPPRQAAGAEPDLDAPAAANVSGQPSFKDLKLPLTARVVDRRFYTREAMYLANEMSESGDPFLRHARILGLPIESDTDFQYMTATEAYWYSRYIMQSIITESRMGLVLTSGPYVTERTIRTGNALYSRDRGENELSNKDVLFQQIIPDYLARTGFPRRFEDASPLMIEFASGDPHFLRPLDKGTAFELPENHWRDRKLRDLYGASYRPPPTGAGVGGNDMWRYRVNYRENFESLRWSNDKMAHYIDLGGAGQTMMKAVLWMEYFFRQTHDASYLGNNPEEGFRGAILNLASVSKMLLLKSSFFYDGKRLQGLNPFTYDPGSKPIYLPHEVSVDSRYIGDLPPYPENFKVKDGRSLLFDQGSLLWALSEYFYFADRNRDRTDPVYKDAYDNWDKVFGDRTPYDGSLMERKYVQLARGLANVVVRNLELMHADPASGALVSEWDPRTRRGHTVDVADLSIAILGLANYHHHLARVEPELSARAGRMLRAQADFLVRVQNADGTFAGDYDAATGTPGAGPVTLLTQASAVRGLLRAYQDAGAARYLDAAREAYGAMDERLWDPQCGLYRSQAGAQVSTYTPRTVAATLGAVREMILVGGQPGQIARFKRFWVQAVDSSGLQQAEYEETGDSDLSAKDSDHDGIPRMEFGDGKYGIAPVPAGRVEIATPAALSADAAQKP